MDLEDRNQHRSWNGHSYRDVHGWARKQEFHHLLSETATTLRRAPDWPH